MINVYNILILSIITSYISLVHSFLNLRGYIQKLINLVLKFF
ncbi:hypothetical protein BBU29805_0778 [Borreliella burgdorferi 29805]|uniref:Uncharacterized protein n=1 Tax=Borreliella burgdorferi (strain ZS7) TaxID=445985 RepID=A0A0H3C0W6_BORBZ|nr:hypothetical protein BbuZS7_0753 [Borreliella burgdorferi ZS7]AGS66727.1 hypothetical protein L144_03590 [Borreliella burgdorferi CA382]EEE18458.1 hypothetical protein BBU72A_0754 [Borreliella burgdorferi 72a]EEF56165.1 hypothetical protein BBU64B_0755 [Borreliella burgdorferi 64b]EEF83872.1 hypothetical protein BBUCA112A_0766 [Borreliella burgdorferi CA-11.2A]EEH31975.1 hypothetical protein BBUBOL26_0748 [Borreliella burgdorferi Bol26]EEH32107.1 hypothetical protein BBU29805_0778 [Borreli